MNDSSAREMNESLAAITERQPQRPCGCIVDENSGGFPNAKNNGMTNTRCESKREIKAPCLVARLMGLESMPAGSGNMDLEMAEIKSLEPGLRRFRVPHHLESPNPCVDSKILKGTSVPSCKYCGYFPNVEEYASSVSSPVSSYSGPSYEGPGRNMPRLPIFSSRDQLETLERVLEGSSSDATVEIDDVSYCAELILGERSTRKTRMEMHGTDQGNNVKKDASSVTHVVNQKQNQTSQNSERGLMKSKPSSLQSNRVLAAAESMNNTQNFVAQNKRPSRKEDLCDDGYAILDSAAIDLVGNSLDHHSSRCVLEAALSTENYLSCSPNSSSKGKALAESVESIDDEPLFPEPDRDLSDCEASSSTRRSCRELITDHFNKRKQTQLRKTDYFEYRTHIWNYTSTAGSTCRGWVLCEPFSPQ
ncbi:hypothetical protein BC332_05175 [Capsicum chinense]|nr:hypothetical protein BC332_05175 [Capsicum chinense]